MLCVIQLPAAASIFQPLTKKLSLWSTILQHLQFPCLLQGEVLPHFLPIAKSFTLTCLL